MTKHKSHDERRDQILAAAKARFIKEGYAHTRVDDIAEEANLSKGGIYFHFKSKREIFDALLDAQQSQTSALLRDADALTGSPTEKLAQLAGVMMRHLALAEDGRKFLIVLAEMGMRDEELMQRIRAAHERYVIALSKHIAEGIESGDFRDDVDPQQVAVLLKMIIDGVEQASALGYPLDANALLLSGMKVIMFGLVKTQA